jgi:hypothetical protein
MVNVCVWEGFGSNSFVTKMQSFPMDGHYRTDIISGVGHLRSDLIIPLVLRTVYCAMARALAYADIYITYMINCHLIILYVFYK